MPQKREKVKRGGIGRILKIDRISSRILRRRLALILQWPRIGSASPPSKSLLKR